MPCDQPIVGVSNELVGPALVDRDTVCVGTAFDRISGNRNELRSPDPVETHSTRSSDSLAQGDMEEVTRWIVGASVPPGRRVGFTPPSVSFKHETPHHEVRRGNTSAAPTLNRDGAMKSASICVICGQSAMAAMESALSAVSPFAMCDGNDHLPIRDRAIRR